MHDFSIMPQIPLMPNLDNASIGNLRETGKAAGATVFQRCNAIILLATGSSHAYVCEVHAITPQTLHNWIKAFNQSGVDGLRDNPRCGAPRKISQDLEPNLLHDLDHPQVDQRTFWTATAFHGYLRAQYQTECGYSTVLRFLHEKNYALKVPQPWPDRQDPKKRKAFLHELKELIEQPDVDIWYADETGVEGEPKGRRLWAQKGSKPRIVKNGDHIRLNILGMVRPRDGEFFAIEASHSDTDVFQVFLDQAARCIKPKRTKNILIVDNASWHTSPKLNWHFFQPKYLPSYSPDLNPIESLWLILKNNWFNNINCKTIDQLAERADQALIELFNHPDKVISATNSKQKYF